jgi:hypothetical protein
MESKKGLRKGMLIKSTYPGIKGIVKIAQTKFDKPHDNTHWLKVWRSKSAEKEGITFALWVDLPNVSIPNTKEKKAWK